MLWINHAALPTQELFDYLPKFLIVQMVAILCGFIIGYERESKGKPAGIRTIILICMGSALFVQMSILLTEFAGDPSRVAAQIVTGVGFLGAGAILQRSERGYVEGMTTAASIWVTAAIGMLVGAHKFILALTSSFLVLGALILLRQIERRFFHDRRTEKRLVLFRAKKGKTEWRLRERLEVHLFHPNEYSFKGEAEDEQKSEILELKFDSQNRNHRMFLADISAWEEVQGIEKADAA